MAKSITQNGIVFSNYNNNEVLEPGTTIKLAGSEGLDTDNFGIVNAVDIAWNSAKVGTRTINTTGQLLAYIKELEERIAILSNNVGTLLGWTTA